MTSAGETELAPRIWSAETIAAVDGVLGRARNRRPGVLVVEGEAGLGKSSLLAELVARAGDFTILRADAFADDSHPFGVFAQWGVTPASTATGATPEPFMIAQQLRELLDRHRGPSLLVLDDLQWADPESVAGLLWLVRRAEAERLVVAVGSRPLGPDRHPGWQRWVAGQAAATVLRLAGLTVEQVHDLLRRRGSTVSQRVARRLVEHAQGNPLYLTALLDEFGADELARREVMPAPAALRSSLAGRLARLSDSARTLVAATAVLSGGWVSLPAVATVATVPEIEPAAQLAVDAGLLQWRAVDSAVRVPHALVRSAILDLTPLGERKRLHLAAAEVVTTAAAALEHRWSAASRYDDELAEALFAHALAARRDQRWRDSARALRRAASVTTDPSLRRERELEGLLDTLLVPDLAAAREALAADPGDDDPRLLVLHGLLAAFDERDAEGITAFRRVWSAGEALDRLTRHRAGTLLAWALVQNRRDLPEATAVLAAAGHDGVVDPSTSFFANAARVFLDHDLLQPETHWAAATSGIDRAQDVALADTDRLTERAVVAIRMGLFGTARDDLEEVTRRVRLGQVAHYSGQIPAGLGYAQWWLGDWPAARISLGLAAELEGPTFYRPYLLIGDGRLAAADQEIAAIWPDPATIRPRVGSNLVHLRVLHAHAVGHRAELSQVGRTLRDPLVRDVANGHVQTIMWLFTAGIALIWAGVTDVALECAQRLSVAAPDWAPTGAAWLRGLAAEAVADHDGALRELTNAVAGPLSLPLLRGHLLVDQARGLRTAGQPVAARSALEQAESVYQRLGATFFADRIRSRLSAMRPAAALVRPARPPLGLSAREADVLGLVLRGMSYSQIAAELFITNKTVGYHLGNMFAKAGVRGRHELAAAARADPEAFAAVG